MRHLLLSAILAALASCNSPVEKKPIPTAPLVSPLARADLDPAAFRQWLAGKESLVSMSPEKLVNTRDSRQEWHGIPAYGEGKELGVRHLRVGFVKPLEIGTVVASGNSVVSALKPGAVGDLGDDSQWLPATKTSDDYALWTLPPGTVTRALRFSHTPLATDKTYAGRVGGVALLAGRFANLAPLAVVSASTNDDKANRVNNGKNDNWKAWDNWSDSMAPEPVAKQSPWVTLVWTEPVTLRGLGTLFGGFGAAEVQAYSGSGLPAEALDSDWITVKSFDNLSSCYPLQLPLQWLDFGGNVTTRAIRLRLTKVAPENHPHLVGNTKDGRRVWLDELLALRPLGDEVLETPVAVADTAHPPIPVRFTLEEPGYVTLVIDDAKGKRVRNLVGETFFPAGDNVAWWDGMDDLGRDADAARHGLYHVPGAFVAPGDYTVRGLTRKTLDLLYEFPVYTAGSPAWNTADNTGAWLSNHTPPCCVQSVQDKVYIGSHISEGTHGLAWVDLEGRKLGGVTWVGGNWTGAQELAYDSTLYVGSTFQGELRLTAKTDSGEKPVFKLAGTKDDLGGLAVRNGLMVCSLTKSGKLLQIDAKTGKQVGEIPLAEPKGLAFDAAGNLLAISGKQVVRPKGTVLIGSGLEAPSHLVLDAAGNIYVSDRGSSHQVKVFSPDGKFLRAIGKPGAPMAGVYDPEHMNNPAGLTIDSRGRLWVAEQDEWPKRVSVWTLAGALVKAFYGPAQYGGGGALDPQDKTLFYYNGLRFKLDWTKGVDKLESVYWRPGSGDPLPPDGHAVGGAPQLPLYVDGRRYFSNCYSSNPTNGAAIASLWLERGGIAKPVAAAGKSKEWSLLKGDDFFVWSDLNGDSQTQPEEFQRLAGASGGVTVMSDLALVVSRIDGKATRFPVANYTPGGAPTYDLKAGEVLATEVQPPVSTGGDQALAHPDGWTVLTAVPKPYSQLSAAGVFKGEPRWSYPDPWPGLHASHEAQVPDRPGMLVGTTRLLGGFINSGVGPLWCVNGNMGPMYLLTADGLFVATLFQDVRQGAPWSMPKAWRGMKLNGVSPHDENFWPSITQTKDGEVYLVDGARTSLVQVAGLDTLRRLPDDTLEVSEDDLEAAREYFAVQEAARQAARGRKSLRVPADGKLSAWMPIDVSGTAANFNSNSKPYDVQAAAAIADGRLRLVFHSGDGNLLRNSGATPNALFKTGGALDLMLSASRGDLRLLVTQVNGKTAATLYLQSVPGTSAKDRVAFASPWRAVYFDKVEDVSGQVRLTGNGGDYELSVPLSLLGMEGTGTFKADVGVLRGDGFQTLRRTYWSNKATAITADVPSEAELAPKLWGEWVVETK